MTEKVLVTYEKGAGDAGGLHNWTYYFDENTASNWRPDASAHNADAQGKTGPKLSETLYEEVRWNVSLPAWLFAPPR